MSEDDQPDDKPLILVVDDEPLLRMDVAAMLEDAGYDVLEAADATTAIDLLEVIRELGCSSQTSTCPGGWMASSSPTSSRRVGR